MAKITAAKVAREDDVDVRGQPPRWDDPLLVAAERVYDEGCWAEAIGLLERGLEASPGEAEAWRFLTWAYNSVDLPTRAVAAAERAIESIR